MKEDAAITKLTQGMHLVRDHDYFGMLSLGGKCPSLSGGRACPRRRWFRPVGSSRSRTPCSGRRRPGFSFLRSRFLSSLRNSPYSWHYFNFLQHFRDIINSHAVNTAYHLAVFPCVKVIDKVAAETERGERAGRLYPAGVRMVDATENP